MKVIGFDLDDTLVPEVLFIKSGIRHIASWLHDRFPSIPELRMVNAMETAVMTRRNHYSALETLISEFRLNVSIDMKEVVTEFRNHRPDPAIYHAQKPGKTLLINHFRINDGAFYIVDLPGYGYAARGKEQREDFRRMIF